MKNVTTKTRVVVLAGITTRVVLRPGLLRTTQVKIWVVKNLTIQKTANSLEQILLYEKRHNNNNRVDLRHGLYSVRRR
jgi:hypothetical protein